MDWDYSYTKSQIKEILISNKDIHYMTKKIVLLFGKENLKGICTFLDEDEIATFDIFQHLLILVIY